MPEDAKKSSSLQSVQPAIPGIPARTPEKPSVAKSAKGRSPTYVWVGGAAILVLVIALFWWAHGVTRAAHATTDDAAPTPAAQPAPPKPVQSVPVAPGTIATISEMKEPWSSKQFVYRNPNGENAPALLVHLSGNSYWAFSLREPYGTCQLEFATVDKLRSDYGLSAGHPMVGDPCTHTVYDLAKYGSGPNGLVRGAVVAGVGVRPPLAIEVQVQGTQIVASRSE